MRIRRHKQLYTTPETGIMHMTLQSIVMTNSVTTHPISTTSVTVDSFEKDSNFGSDGTFDLNFDF